MHHTLRLLRVRRVSGDAFGLRVLWLEVTMMSMTVLMFLILYLYACMGVELITKNEVLESR